MKWRCLLSIVMLGVLFVSSGNPAVAAPLSRTEVGGEAAKSPFEPAALVSQGVLRDEGGPLVADNDYRRIEFTTEGVYFAPRKDGELTPGHELTYRLAEVRSGQHLYFSTGSKAGASPSPTVIEENRVDYIHQAGITERYLVDDQGLEQLFLLEEPLALDGDLEITGRFDTSLTPLLDDPLKGVRFLDGEMDVIHYSGAVVFDAAGRRTPAPLSLSGNLVTILVPREWLATATYPVTIDPRLEGGLVYVAYITNDQDTPAVAYSTASGQYLVVFESDSNNGDILGRFVSARTGQLLGSVFYITSSPFTQLDPDVAYDPYRDRFLVVWEERVCLGVPQHCYYVIQGRLVYGGYRGEAYFPGPQFTVASEWSSITSGFDLRNPAVAYNADDHQFLVVYRRGHEYYSSTFTDIYGQMLSSHSREPNRLGPLKGFQIRSYTSRTVASPDVAWSKDGNTFLAVWNVERDSEADYIAAAYLYDTYQGGGTQVYAKRWLIAPYDRGSDPLTNDCSEPAVAYDPVAKAYVVVFEHRESGGTLGIRTIHGQRVRPEYNTNTFRYDADYAFPIETNTDATRFFGHYQPDIAFSGLSDEMHVVYRSYRYVSWTLSYHWINDRALHGTSVKPRLQIRYRKEGLEDPAVAGSHNGRCLVVWREEDVPGDWDILGQRVWPAPINVYMPIVVQRH